MTKFCFTFKTLKINFTKVVETSFTNNSRSFSGFPDPGHYIIRTSTLFPVSNVQTIFCGLVNFSLKMNLALSIRVEINSSVSHVIDISWLAKLIISMGGHIIQKWYELTIGDWKCRSLWSSLTIGDWKCRSLWSSLTIDDWKCRSQWSSSRLVI